MRLNILTSLYIPPNVAIISLCVSRKSSYEKKIQNCELIRMIQHPNAKVCLREGMGKGKDTYQECPR